MTIDYCDCGVWPGSHCRPKYCDRNAIKVGGAIYEETCKIAQDDESSGTLTMHADRFKRLGHAAVEAMK